MNGVYLRELAPDDFIARTLPLVEADLGGRSTTRSWRRLAVVAPLVQERAKLLTEVGPPGEVPVRRRDRLRRGLLGQGDDQGRRPRRAQRGDGSPEP